MVGCNSLAELELERHAAEAEHGVLVAEQAGHRSLEAVEMELADIVERQRTVQAELAELEAREAKLEASAAKVAVLSTRRKVVVMDQARALAAEEAVSAREVAAQQAAAPEPAAPES